MAPAALAADPTHVASSTIGSGFYAGRIGPSQSDRAAKTTVQLRTERLRANADFLTEYQRKSGVRVRPCTSGCYLLYDADGYCIGRTTPPGALLGLAAAALPEVATRMAMSGEMLAVCRLVDTDVEATGAVTGTTVDLVRALLATMGAA